MLKKPVILFLIALYLITASGFSLNLHYCLGQLASVRIDTPAKECVTGNKVKKRKCCRDEHLEVKVKDAHKGASIQTLGKLFAFSMPLVSFLGLPAKLPTFALTRSSYRGPPPLQDKPLYLQNQNFRI